MKAPTSFLLFSSAFSPDKLARREGRRGEFAARREDDVAKILVGNKEVAEVKRRVTESGPIFRMWSKWTDEEGQRVLEIANKTEEGKAEPY